MGPAWKAGHLAPPFKPEKPIPVSTPGGDWDGLGITETGDPSPSDPEWWGTARCHPSGNTWLLLGLGITEEGDPQEVTGCKEDYWGPPPP